MELDHIALIVSCEDNLRFYEKLGFKKTKRIKRSYDTIVFMECDGIVLEVFVDSNHPERLEQPEAKGLRHIAFSIESLEDLDIEHGQIRNDWFGRKFIFVKDYDGQPIELKEKYRGEK